MASNYIPSVDYTSRDYAAIRDDMIALIPYLLPEWTTTDASDFGITLIELFAYEGDKQNYYIDRAANEGFIATATQRSSVLSIANMLGYTPSTGTPAKVTLTFSNATNSSITVPALTQVATTTNVNGVSTQIVFETDSEITVTANSSNTVSATQGKTTFYEHLGDSDGTANQVFAFANHPLISKTSSIIVGTLVGGIPTGTAYTEVPYLIDAGYNDPSYSVYTDADGISYINFGDGISGRIPSTNGIYVTYRVGGGASGNVGPGTLNYQLNNVVAGLRVSNLAGATGGADPETTDSIRFNTPYSLTALNRAVSLADYSALSIQIPSIAKAIADSGSSYNNIILYIAPFGDSNLGTPGIDASGAPTATFTNASTDLIKYLTDKAPATTTVTINPPVYVPINITLTAHLLPQYKQKDVTTAINQVLSTLFDFTNVIFAEQVVLQYVHTAISSVPGIDYVDITLLTRADSTFTGNIAYNSPTISNVSSFNNVAVGQQVALTAGSAGTVTIASGTTIQSFDTGAKTITLSANAGGSGSTTSANIWTSSIATTGINKIPCATYEIPKSGVFTIVPSGGIVG
jgi:Baseplate J-like protein